MSRAGPGPGPRVRAYAYTLVTTAIVLFFALAEWAVERYVSEVSKAATTAIEIAIVLVAALVFRPIHQRVEGAIEAAFTKRKREALAAIAAFRREMSSFNDLNQLLRRVIEALEQRLDASACAVYLRREVFHAEASSFDLPAADVDLGDPLAVRLRSSTAPAKPQLLNSSACGTHAFPMTAAGDLVGFLSVHRKHGDYDDEELQMLGGLAQDLAVCLVALDPMLRPKKATVPNNLPADLPALVGRERERKEIAAGLSQSRLVTITGPGGVGKTRIALQCAADALSEHEDGAWFVDLAPVADASLVAATIGSALGVKGPQRGEGAERLIEHLRPRNALIVIDNCEHVIVEAARIIAQIRAACPDVTVLATSRELLRLESEQVYRLGALNERDAVELFAQRAAAVSPGFDARQHEDVVRSLCSHLDGVPLAIELAAARTRAISVEETLVHLNERFKLLKSTARTAQPRQQTLAATIEWSYDLLTSEEQSLFRRLSVFRGSFSLAAAAAVCAQDGNCDEYHVLDVLTSLSDKSLVVAQTSITTRYRLLETIREFAAQASPAEESEAVQSLHAAFFSELAAQAYHEFDSRLPSGWLGRLAPDIDNFRAALEWALNGGDPVIGANLAADCGPIFLRLMLLDEGLRWCERARGVADLPPATAGRIEYVASMMHNNAGANKSALACAERALEFYNRSSDERGAIRALSQVAQQYTRNQRIDEARAPAAEAIRRARSLGEPRVLSGVLRRCAFSLPPAEIEDARSYFSEALQIAQSVREPEEESMVLQWWASREAASGAYERAIELDTEALQRARDDESHLHLHGQIASWTIALGRLEQAEPHVRTALALALKAHHPLRPLIYAYCAGIHARQDAQEAGLILGYAEARLRELEWQPDSDDALAIQNIVGSIDRELDGKQTGVLRDRGASLHEDEVLAMLRNGSASSGEMHAAPVGARNSVRALLI